MIATDKWREFYNAAVLETDWSQMDARIQAAEDAMKARLNEFSLNHGGTPEENHAISDCLNKLNILRAELASWKGSQRAT